MADVVVTTGVHATGDVQVQFTDVEQVVQVVEATLDRFGNRDRLGVGQGAEVTPGQQMISVSRPMFGVANPARATRPTG